MRPGHWANNKKFRDCRLFFPLHLQVTVALVVGPEMEIGEAQISVWQVQKNSKAEVELELSVG